MLTNNSCNDLIFFRVWRNKKIRNEILFHTRLYNIHLNRETILPFDDLHKYKYKSYLNNLHASFNGDEKEAKETYELKCVPTSVTNLTIDYIKIKQGSIPDSVRNFTILYESIRQEFVNGELPDTITNLNFGYQCNFNQKLSLEWLPKSLKSLSLCESFQQDISIGDLPNSLTELKLNQSYLGTIQHGAIPPLVKSLDYSFNSQFNQNKLMKGSIPRSTINLVFDHSFNQIIKKGDIPHNVVSLKFLNLMFDSDIEVCAFPSSLKSLDLSYSFSFKKSIGQLLSSSNLTSINMYLYKSEPLIPNLFPRSITDLKFQKFDHPIPDGYFYGYTNLKSLEFNGFNEIIPAQTLPHSLTSLNLGETYDKPLDVKVLPPSLLKLTLNCPKQVVSGKQLPSSITSLSLYSIHPIAKNWLPSNLKKLYLTSSYFNQDLTNNLLPSTLKTIYISDNNFDFINNIDIYFFNKYIKFNKNTV